MPSVSTHGRAFELVGTRPYKRKDGAETTIKVWRGVCVSCAAAFEVTTPGTVTRARESHAFNTRRCPACRGAKIAT